MIDRIARIVFVIELLLLAVPAVVHYAISFAALADLASVVVPLGDGGATAGPSLSGLVTLGLFAFAFSSFCVLAVRYLVGGGAGVARVTPIVWGLAILGQAITVPSVIWAGLFEFAPNAVRAVALLTFPALGLFIPLAHMSVAALIARRDRALATPA